MKTTTNIGDCLPVLAERRARFLESSDYVPMTLSDFDTRHGLWESRFFVDISICFGLFGYLLFLITCSLLCYFYFSLCIIARF